MYKWGDLLAENDDIQQKLQSGIEAVRDGDRSTGRQLLQEVIDANPNNELAWMWMASCVTTLRERRDCLEQVLTINPENARAREALARLDAAGRPAEPEEEPSAPAAKRDTIDQLRGVAEAPKRQAARPRQPSDQKPSGGRLGVTSILIVILAVLAAVLVIVVVPGLDIFQETTPTPLPTAPPTSTQDVEAVVFPTNTPDPDRRTGGLATLPPTFTPTALPTATETPLPSPTPYPMSQFQALYISLEPGALFPAMYQIAGDGTQELMMGGNVRDVAYSPDGQQVAFIRVVEYPSEEENDRPLWLPELFVTSLDNMRDAQAITQMNTSIVSSPTWSPEGNAIVFVSNVDGDEELYFITPGGDNLRQLTMNENSDRDPAWSPIPGSRRVVFASDLGSIGSTELYAIDIIDPDQLAEYTQLTNTSRGNYAPAWSLDGRYITFASDRSGDADIYYMLPDGRMQTLVTMDDNDAEDRNPSFGPDGRFIAFTSNRLDDRFQTYLISLKGDVLVRVTDTLRNDVSIVYRPDQVLSMSP